jgi:hypothetical protein
MLGVHDLRLATFLGTQAVEKRSLREPGRCKRVFVSNYGAGESCGSGLPSGPQYAEGHSRRLRAQRLDDLRLRGASAGGLGGRRCGQRAGSASGEY